jgi:hypothetical protein
MSSVEEQKVVELPKTVDFNQPLYDWNGKPIEEAYFEDEDQARGAELQEKLQLVKRLDEKEAMELIGLRKTRPITLGNQCLNALGAELQDDKALDGTQKFKRYRLAELIQGDHGETEDWAVTRVSNKNKKLIMEMAEKLFSHLVYSRMRIALNWRVDEGAIEDDDED